MKLIRYEPKDDTIRRLVKMIARAQGMKEPISGDVAVRVLFNTGDGWSPGNDAAIRSAFDVRVTK